MCIVKPKESCKVLKNKEISPNIYEMVIEIKTTTNIKAGQFVNVYCKSKANLLPRPISICEVNKDENWIKIIYACVGIGTSEFSTIKENEFVEIMYPLGNGFTIKDNSVSILVGGGVGTPPLLELAKRLKGEKIIVLGFREKPYLIDEFKKYGKVYVATDDGSYGYKGNVIDLIKENNIKGNYVYSCGPKPMLKALQKWINDENLDGQFSLEERMGCGFGACVGCVCKIKSSNEHGFTYKKVCVDGPVFNCKEVLFE